MQGGRTRILVQPEHDTLTPEQRAGFVLVAVTGICAIIVGGFYVMRTLNKPFDISYEGPLLLSPSEQRALEVERQKTQDTDGDSLTDYDELYNYRSSPYLRDTDGDGVGDAAEVQIDGGVNSNGSVVAGGAGVGSGEFLDTFGQIFGSSFYVPTPDVASLDSATQTGGIEDLSQVTPEFLRQSLRAQGATEDQLRYVTDQQLLERYLEVLEQYKQQQAQEQAQSETGGTQPGSTNTESTSPSIP